MRGLSFRLLLVLCLVASTVQGFIAQTHVHARPGAAVAAGSASAAADRAATGEPACALCDVAGHTPAVAPPSHDPSPVPSSAGLPAPQSGSASAFATIASHHWLGRAPPTA